MSNIIKHINTYGSLFNCAVHEFDVMIKNALNKLIITRYANRKSLEIDINYADKFNKCVICLQNLMCTQGLIICHNCCNVCIGKKVMISFGTFEMSTTSMINFDTFVLYTIMMYDDYQTIHISEYQKYFVDHYYSFPFDTKHNVLNHFVNNSPKLRSRFYHVAPVTLLLSLRDPASECYVLNDDIMFYILKLIY